MSTLKAIDTTTEFRSHWIDGAGRRYAQLHPYYTGQLAPVINLDEVRAWLVTARQVSGFPAYDGAVHAFRLLADRGPAIVGAYVVGEICHEITDDVPRYHGDWSAPFVAMREQWPLPPLGGLVEVRNLTPHTVRVGEIDFPATGVIARARETVVSADPIRVSIPDPTGALTDRLEYAVPTSIVTYSGTVDLPLPEPGVMLIVSMVTAAAAHGDYRWTGDLLVPGEQVRDSSGRVVGCRSLARVATA